MEYKDYYKVMGIGKEATQAEIKRAFRKLARKYHPDVSKEKDAEDKFKEVGEAYEVLKDPKKRAVYDQLGANWKSGQAGFEPPPDWDAGFEFHGGTQTGDQANAADFSDFFASLFGQQTGGFQGSHQARHTRGEDSHTKVFIDLEDAYHGASRNLTLRTSVLGADGRPEIKSRTLNIKIPKGIKEGQNIRLQGQGSPGTAEGKAGDLYLKIEFNPHPNYKVKGLDVSLELPITPWEAMLGAKVQIPTPAGKVDLTIPAASSSGKRMRLKGRGIPAKIAGDFYITLEIILPDKLNEREKSLYQALQQESGSFNPRVKLGV
ncbi:MAG TPA: J domain-containing protein [Methyloprofundus sp.]|uniref:DnaJ C-terminal domain-containing protein n=1 Tax=Methyloprofundus sp. TaxID=2020875 RepID=UPI00179E84D3|nr:DnaJ C-terminal domain-containing protein [Methyloprofundus sp.]HIG65960.1 J domain-containing protein [Methyloprofundus sp.]HIL78578.1 J domain-containing protein [Methylococcales bacterium]